jgi:type IV secretory pathway VirB2 component (pilin)
MNISLKYGLPITAVLIAWVVVVRLLMGVGPNSAASMTGPILFNLAAVTCIFLGIVRRKNDAGGDLSFKDSVKTGLGISLVYAASSCLFFIILYFAMGPDLLISEPMAQNRPLWQVAVFAYTGLFFGSLIFGLIYSTVISMFLAKRRSDAK